MDLLLAAETRPFAIAALILVAVIGVEMIALMPGASVSHLFAKAFEGNHHGRVADIFCWVSAARAAKGRPSAARSCSSTATALDQAEAMNSPPP
jgi:hypothetical protein